MTEITTPATLSALWEEVRLQERPPLPLFVADIGVATSPAVRVHQGAPSAVAAGQIVELGDLRVFGAIETVEGRGLTAVPLPSGSVKEGELVPLPPRSACEVKVGQPAELMLPRPAEPPGAWRVERIIRFAR